MSTPPITYRETTWNTRRVFELTHDHIHVALKSQHVDSQSTILLRDLRPEVERIRFRHLLPFRLGVVFLVLSLTCLLLAIYRSDPNHKFASGAVAFLIVGGPILILFARKIDYARFKSPAGIALLDVGKAGPDKRQYDVFIAELCQRIQAAQVELQTQQPQATDQPKATS